MIKEDMSKLLIILKNTFYEKEEKQDITINFCLYQEKDNKKFFMKITEHFTKTPLANFQVYFFKHVRVSIPGKIPR